MCSRTLCEVSRGEGTLDLVLLGGIIKWTDQLGDGNREGGTASQGT